MKLLITNVHHSLEEKRRQDQPDKEPSPDEPVIEQVDVEEAGNGRAGYCQPEQNKNESVWSSGLARYDGGGQGDYEKRGDHGFERRHGDAMVAMMPLFAFDSQAICRNIHFETPGRPQVSHYLAESPTIIALSFADGPVLHARFIAIEGIDQAGKKTQTGLLLARLRRTGFKTASLSFPIYNTSAGRQLRAFLAGRREYPWETLHMLYSLNRWENKKRILNALKSVDVLVADRYTPSNLAYGTAHGLNLRWLAGLDEGLPEPDIVILLDVLVPSSFDRKKQRRDVHESNSAFLLRVKSAYLRLAHKYHWRVVEGTGPPEQAHENIWKIVKTTF